jgi:hypothetical protein
LGFLVGRVGSGSDLEGGKVIASSVGRELPKDDERTVDVAVIDEEGGEACASVWVIRLLFKHLAKDVFRTGRVTVQQGCATFVHHDVECRWHDRFEEGADRGFRQSS